MTRSGLLIFILLAITIGIAWKMARRWRARKAERKWLPKELQHADLAFAEKTFRTWQPIRLIARADRGYRWRGELHLAEFKTRARAVAYIEPAIRKRSSPDRARSGAMSSPASSPTTRKTA